MRKMRSTLVVAVSLALLGLLGGVAAAQQEEGELASSGSEPWDLVWFSDSLGFDVADLWAAKIEEELGVEVRVHDHAAGYLTAVEILTSLDEPTPEERAEIAQNLFAEVRVRDKAIVSAKLASDDYLLLIASAEASSQVGMARPAGFEPATL